MPLVNVPMIEYSLELLAANGVQEVASLAVAQWNGGGRDPSGAQIFVVCASKAHVIEGCALVCVSVSLLVLGHCFMPMGSGTCVPPSGA